MPRFDAIEQDDLTALKQALASGEEPRLFTALIQNDTETAFSYIALLESDDLTDDEKTKLLTVQFNAENALSLAIKNCPEAARRIVSLLPGFKLETQYQVLMRKEEDRRNPRANGLNNLYLAAIQLVDIVPDMLKMIDKQGIHDQSVLTHGDGDSFLTHVFLHHPDAAPNIYNNFPINRYATL